MDMPRPTALPAAGGMLSLENRLREASRMRGMVVELLEDLEDTLTDGILFNFLLVQ